MALRFGSGSDDACAGRVNPDLGAVEHLDPEDVEMLRGTGAHDLGERREADPHQLAAKTLCGLLLQQFLVANLLERDVERLLIVAAVVREAEARLIRELILPHEVLAAHFHRIHAELVGQDVHRALDRVARLGDAERAAVRDAARRLVGEIGIVTGSYDVPAAHAEVDAYFTNKASTSACAAGT